MLKPAKAAQDRWIWSTNKEIHTVYEEAQRQKKPCSPDKKRTDNIKMSLFSAEASEST